MKKTRYIIAVAIVTIFSINQTVSHAQSDSTKSSYSESVIVVGDYNPVLDGVTEKVNVAPSASENAADNTLPAFNYSITPRRITSISATSGIKAAKVICSPTKLYNNYIRLGVGHDFASFADFNPLMDLYYTSTRHDNYAYGARLYHQTDVTTFGKKNDTEPSPDHFGRNRQSITSFDVFGKYILNKKHLFSADLAYDREYGRYYGFSDSMLLDHLTLNRDDIKYSKYAFAYNNLALNMGAKSLNTDINNLGYEADLSLADFWNRQKASQLSIDLDASVHYGFPMFRQYKAIAYLHANWKGYKQRFDIPAFADGMPLGYGANAALPDSVNNGRHLLNVGPYVDFLFKDLKFHAGFELGVNAFDSDKSDYNFLPDVSVSKSFAHNAISLTVGLKGYYTPNDWNSIRMANPNVGPAPLSKVTVTNDLYARFRINFSKKLILNIHVDNKFNKNNMYFEFDTNYTLRNVFKPYYVDENNFDFGADFTFVNDEMITVTLGMDYLHDYGVPKNVPILYSPDFTAHLDASVNYDDKWFFTLKTLFIGRMNADYEYNTTSGYNEITTKLPSRFGVALGVEYVHSRALSFFANLDNLTFQRYFTWANYPEARFNAMIGLTYTIPNQK